MSTAVYVRDSLDRDRKKVTTAYQLEHTHTSSVRIAVGKMMPSIT